MKGDFFKQLETPVIEVDENRPPQHYVEHSAVKLHAWLLISLVIAIIGLMLIILSGVIAIPAPDSQSSLKISEVRVLFLAIISGAAGAAVHALTAFAGYAGNRQLTRSWLPWIYLRIPIGSLLAALVYFGIRAGVFSAGEFKTMQHVFIVVFVCSLSGMFSKQVSDKLSDLIDNLLMPQNKPVRADPLEQSVPAASAASQQNEQPSVPEETVQEVQRRLIVLGYLSAALVDGKSADDGVLGSMTLDAIEDFLGAEGIVGEVRDAALGEESGPDYWPNLLELLAQAVEVKQQSNP